MADHVPSVNFKVRPVQMLQFYVALRECWHSDELAFPGLSPLTPCVKEHHKHRFWLYLALKVILCVTDGVFAEVQGNARVPIVSEVLYYCTQNVFIIVLQDQQAPICMNWVSLLVHLYDSSLLCALHKVSTVMIRCHSPRKIQRIYQCPISALFNNSGHNTKARYRIVGRLYQRTPIKKVWKHIHNAKSHHPYVHLPQGHCRLRARLDHNPQRCLALRKVTTPPSSFSTNFSRITSSSCTPGCRTK